MSKRSLLFSIVCLSALFALSNGYAERFFTKEEALDDVFGKGAKIEVETKELQEPQLSKIRKLLGGSLVSNIKGAKAKIPETTSFDFYFKIKDGKREGVALIDTEQGRWGPIEYIIAMDTKGAVTRVDVMSFKEKRGKPISRHSFLGQFEGKTCNDKFEVNKDISGIGGATISAKSASFAVKKATTLYSELYLK